MSTLEELQAHKDVKEGEVLFYSLFDTQYLQALTAVKENGGKTSEEFCNLVKKLNLISTYYVAVDSFTRSNSHMREPMFPLCGATLIARKEIHEQPVIVDYAKEAAEKLVPGKAYTVAYPAVGHSYSKIVLNEFPGVSFSADNFEFSHKNISFAEFVAAYGAEELKKDFIDSDDYFARHNADCEQELAKKQQRHLEWLTKKYGDVVQRIQQEYADFQEEIHAITDPQQLIDRALEIGLYERFYGDLIPEDSSSVDRPLDVFGSESKPLALMVKYWMDDNGYIYDENIDHEVTFAGFNDLEDFAPINNYRLNNYLPCQRCLDTTQRILAKIARDHVYCESKNITIRFSDLTEDAQARIFDVLSACYSDETIQMFKDAIKDYAETGNEDYELVDVNFWVDTNKEGKKWAGFLNQRV